MRLTTHLVWILLACGGCAMPFTRQGCTSCGDAVAECDDASLCRDPCEGGPGVALPLACGGYDCVCSACSPAIGFAQMLVCWPVRTCFYAINFCAPDGFVGPSAVPGPGRFHPVPTHPVFEPAGPATMPEAPM